MGKVKSKKTEKTNKGVTKRKMFNWIIMTLILALIMGILYGTVEHYLNTTPLIFGLYISWQEFTLTIGIAVWAFLSLIIFKSGDKK